MTKQLSREVLIGKILRMDGLGMTRREVQAGLLKQGIKVSHGLICKIIKNASKPALRSNKKFGNCNWREWTKPMRTLQALKHQSSFSQDTALIEIGKGEGVGLINLSDLHMAAWSTNHDSLISITDEILSIKNLYVSLLGDYGQYAIVLRNMLEVADNLLPPEQQTDFLDSWFNEIYPKVAFATWENHGIERQEKLAGESSTKRILSRKVVYFGGIGHPDVKIGGQVYNGAVSHRFRGRSILNPVHGMMRYMRMEGVGREWAMMGDTHVPGIAKYTDGDKVRVAVNSGSIQTNSGYGKRYFSLKTHEVFPVIHFDPDEHSMTPYWSVREWLKR
jgi:hypothetical protein